MLMYKLGYSWCYALIPCVSGGLYACLYFCIASLKIKKNFVVKCMLVVGENSYGAYLVSFIFAWYIPILLTNIFTVDEIIMLVFTLGIAAVLIPFIARFISYIQSCVVKIIK